MTVESMKMRILTREEAKSEKLWPITTEINANSETAVIEDIEKTMVTIPSAAWVEIRKGIVECWRGGRRSYSRNKTTNASD